MRDPTAYRIDVFLRTKLFAIALLIGAVVTPPLLIWLALPLLKPILADQFSFSLLMMGLMLFTILNFCGIAILAERKISAFIQDRKGPNRVGFWGMLQPLADGVKFILKEEITPGHADKPLFILAPCLAFTLALVGFAVVPWAGDVHWPWMEAGKTVSSQAADIDIGFLYMLMVAAMAVYGVVLAGWASNNKYAFYGGMRAGAQMLSYEVPMAMGLLCVLLVHGDLRLGHIVGDQAHSGIWNIFVHPVAFVLVFISALAEANRTPFDLAECEQELVAGFHTEYSSMKFALFFLGEYAHMFTSCALMTALFLGGWAPLPFTTVLVDDTSWIAFLIKFGVFIGKVMALIFLFMLVRWTIPRFRFDQLMRLAWKLMVPIGMAMVLASGLAIGWGWRINPAGGVVGNALNWLIMLGLNVVAIIGTMWLSMRTERVTGRQDNLPGFDAHSGRWEMST